MFLVDCSQQTDAALCRIQISRLLSVLDDATESNNTAGLLVIFPPRLQLILPRNVHRFNSHHAISVNSKSFDVCKTDYSGFMKWPNDSNRTSEDLLLNLHIDSYTNTLHLQTTPILCIK